MPLENIKIRRKLTRSPNHYPRLLYKYKSVEPLVHVRDIVVESRLWFSKPSDFNDPFDTKINVSVSGSPADKIRRFKKALKRTNNFRETNSNLDTQATKLYADLKRKNTDLTKLAYESHETTMATCGIICFSEDPRNILLWSHYGHRHEGICFQFTIANDVDNFCRAIPTKYTVDYPVHDWVKDNDRKLLDGIYTKFEGWKYETERRIVYPNYGHQYLNFNANALTGIILGCRTSIDKVEKIIDIIEERKSKSLNPIRIYRAVQSKSSYSLRIYRHRALV